VRRHASTAVLSASQHGTRASGAKRSARLLDPARRSGLRSLLLIVHASRIGVAPETAPFRATQRSSRDGSLAPIATVGIDALIRHARWLTCASRRW
jgi:hypothetical protein